MQTHLFSPDGSFSDDSLDEDYQLTDADDYLSDSPVENAGIHTPGVNPIPSPPISQIDSTSERAFLERHFVHRLSRDEVEPSTTTRLSHLLP